MSDRVTLALGPTNTGKTHRAIERMLEHESGAMGLPLRLLAREVYDRISTRVGERAVALITGEERRIPPAPRYWICTVEAMPDGLEVDFVAIDEVQLAAHRERGHVFTDRILHARGRLETWFLGADTMTDLLRELLPGAELRRQQRLSVLRHTGGRGLGALPPRSAAVTFSADGVYDLAARIRARHGGAAVVIGALSPRTRNAQVALYEAREVQFLVATDAIGMGLNLDIEHVAFASRRKFDGREHRPLEADELAQIAGRAGRHRRDGTFGTLNPASALSTRVASRIEEHRFAAVRRLVWRNSDLDFDSVEALITSLARPSPDERLMRIERADDFDALRTLAQRSTVRQRLSGPSELRLLWDVCQVPDYRKLLLVHHADLLEEIFTHLTESGRIDPAWVMTQLRRIDRVEGEVDALTARIAAVRVWTYVAHRPDWLDDARGWQERTRALEDRLSDALHERLVERFVERRRTTRSVAAEPPEGSPFAALADLLHDARRETAAEEGAWVEALVAAEHSAFGIESDGDITWRDRRLGRLRRGRTPLEPDVTLVLSDEVGAGAQTRIRRRVRAFVRDWVGELLEPLSAETGEPALRGLLYQLERGLGAISRRDAKDQLQALTPDARSALSEMDVIVGRRAVYAVPLLSPEGMRRRALLLRCAGVAAPDPAGPPTRPRDRDVAFPDYVAAGYLPAGPYVIRLDAVDRALDALEQGEGRAAEELGVNPEEVNGALRGLGYRKAKGRWQRSRRRRRR